ncbi:hypothetical protein Tco_1442741, partial [Tanacetum coccineum]
NLNGASSSKVNYVDSRKNNKGNDKKRKGTWNSSKDNKKDKKPLSEELHMASVTTTTDDWWYDSGATTHVCNNRDLFKTYKETKDGHEVMMGDNHTLKVIGSGNVEIQFTSERISIFSLERARKERNLDHDFMAESSSAPKKSERARKERNLDHDFIDSQAIIFLVEGDNENNVINKIPILLNVEDAPKTYKEAITSRNYAFWKEVIDDEMDSLVSNNT